MFDRRTDDAILNEEEKKLYRRRIGGVFWSRIAGSTLMVVRGIHLPLTGVRGEGYHCVFCAGFGDERGLECLWLWRRR